MFKLSKGNSADDTTSSKTKKSSFFKLGEKLKEHKITKEQIIFFIFWVIIGLIGGGIYFASIKLNKETKNIGEQNTKLRVQINSYTKKTLDITKIGSQKFDNLLQFYQDYFRIKNQLYMLDVIYILETVLPTNNFVKSINLTTNTVNLTIEFQARQLNDFIKIKNNLKYLKEKGFILSYKIGGIKRKDASKNLENNNKVYVTAITFKPNISEELRQYLYKKYKSYRVLTDTYSIKRMLDDKLGELEPSNNKKNVKNTKNRK